MKATRTLHELGQSLWFDHVTRGLLDSGKLKRFIEAGLLTGLTSYPAAFEHAIRTSPVYDAAICKKLREDKSGEELFFELALEDLSRAADLFRPIYDHTDGEDGWVSLEVSPRLAHDTDLTLAAAKDLFARARRPNIFIKIPGTVEGLPAVEEAIFAGVPVNVTRLFSREHYLAAAAAYLHGIERRIAAGLKPVVGSVASLSVNCWDDAVAGKVPEALRGRLAIAIANRAYKASRDLLDSPRWERAFRAGARPQRLMWAGTETGEPEALEFLYVKALAGPHTIIVMAESALSALADHGDLGGAMPADGGDCEAVLARFARAGVDIDALAGQLQDEANASFVRSWIELMGVIASKSAALTQAHWQAAVG